MRTYFQCDRCGTVFDFEYYDNGSIAHENATSDWNLRIAFDEKRIHKLPSGKCTKEFIDNVMKCRRIWVLRNHPEYLETFDAELAKQKGWEG